LICVFIWTDLLKIRFPQGNAGSIPAAGTKKATKNSAARIRAAAMFNPDKRIAVESYPAPADARNARP
jgi:hypothetical protein